MGQGRRSVRKPGFIEVILDAVETFYGEVLQNLRAVIPAAPRLERRTDAETAGTGASEERSQSQ
ncbi:hypothetical protein [Candidatus Poriferisodalis sp.]|uniref:hypothetical protein n=1 Tax=Candidatus Poriferisodalis sp. TaxID=3101277 RepID=UPI003B02616D